MRALQHASFSSWGWAVGRRAWHAHLARAWTPLGDWDVHVRVRVQQRKRLLVLAPAVARARHVGARGVHFRSRGGGGGGGAAPAPFLDELEPERWGSTHLAFEPRWLEIDGARGALDDALRVYESARPWYRGACTPPARDARGRNRSGTAADTCSFVAEPGLAHTALVSGGGALYAAHRALVAAVALGEWRGPRTGS